MLPQGGLMEWIQHEALVKKRLTQNEGFGWAKNRNPTGVIYETQTKYYVSPEQETAQPNASHTHKA